MWMRGSCYSTGYIQTLVPIFKIVIKVMALCNFKHLGLSRIWYFEGGRAFRTGRVKGVRRKGEGPGENWEKVQVLRICRGAGVVTSRVIRDEYRI